MKDYVKMYLMTWKHSSFELFDKLVTALSENKITHGEYVDHYMKLLKKDKDTIEFVSENFKDETIKI